MEKADPKLIESIKKQIERLGSNLILRGYDSKRGWYFAEESDYIQELVDSQLEAGWVKESLDLIEHAINSHKDVKDCTVKWYIDGVGSINAIVYSSFGIIRPDQCWNDGCSSEKKGTYMLRWSYVDAQSVIDGYARAKNLDNDGTIKANDPGLIEWHEELERNNQLWEATHATQTGYDFDVYSTRADALDDVYNIPKLFEKNRYKLRKGPITDTEKIVATIDGNHDRQPLSHFPHTYDMHLGIDELWRAAHERMLEDMYNHWDPLDREKKKMSEIQALIDYYANPEIEIGDGVPNKPVVNPKLKELLEKYTVDEASLKRINLACKDGGLYHMPPEEYLERLKHADIRLFKEPDKNLMKELFGDAELKFDEYYKKQIEKFNEIYQHHTQKQDNTTNTPDDDDEMEK